MQMSAHKTNLKVIPPRSDLCYSERFNEDSFRRYRLTGDPLGDKVCESLQKNHGGLTNIHNLLSTVQDLSTKDPLMREFLDESCKVPSWANPERVERGQRIHAVLYPFMGISLFSGSLVGGSQFIISSIVTALAGNITTDPTRRITETGMLLASLAFPGSLVKNDGEAHISLTKVRLLHSALRTWLPTTTRMDSLPEAAPKSAYVEKEVPINQHDLAITLGIFCYLNLRSLRRMSIVLSKQDIEAYVHMWKYAGYVLGIMDELLPDTLEDQEEFMLASMKHQGFPELIPGEATKKFINAFSNDFSVKTLGVVPPSVFDTYLQQMTRYLNGEEYIQGMEIEDLGNYHWSVIVTRAMGYMMGTVIPRLPLGERLLFRRHIAGIKKMLREKGEITGHGAGTGEDITKQSRL